MPDLTREEFMTIKAAFDALNEQESYKEVLPGPVVDKIEAAAAEVDKIYKIYKEHRR